MVSKRSHDYTSVQRAVKRKHSEQARARVPDPSKPPNNGACPFLRKLPAEIRNHIYELVLWASEGLFYRTKDWKPRLCSPISGQICEASKRQKLVMWQEANQLQYINKQVRAETKGFGVRLNTLHFTTLGSSKNQPSSLGMCLEFMKALHPGHFRHLCTITIRQQEEIGSVGLYPNEECYGLGGVHAHILDICRANPTMTVEWACPDWKLQDNFRIYMVLGIVLTLAYRTSTVPNRKTEGYSISDHTHEMNVALNSYSVDSSHIRSRVSSILLDDTNSFNAFVPPRGMHVTLFFTVFQSSLRFWRRIIGKALIYNVPNFKIFPIDVIKSREDYKKEIEDTAKACVSQYRVSSQEPIETWTAKAMEWYDNGI